MKGAKRPLGYTIIEVMIVLVISGLMFLIASSFIGGKSQTTAFTEGVNEFASQIQNTIQQVTNGQYSDIPLNCSLIGGADPLATISIPPVGSNSQGTNAGCVFLGKMLVFSGAGSPDYSVVSLAGGQLNPGYFINGITATSAQLLIDSDPTIIHALTTPHTVPQQINIMGTTVTDLSGATSTDSIYNFGFIQSLGTPDGNGNFQPGAQPISIVYSPINSNSNISGTLDYARSVTVCLSDGTQPGSHQANVTMGTSGDKFGVSVARVNFVKGAVCPS
jgi:prepilin-type N-terminal cleavage/methylation domain-containing protein